MSTPEPYWCSEDGDVVLYLGDCLSVLAAMEADSVDAIVTDPPAAVSFMGREWDSDRGGRDKWVGWLADRMEAAARVLKPGGHALVWSLPRTSHWTAWALEDAGLEIRDCIMHAFGSGFPKSLDVSKAIDKAAGAEREIIGDGQPFGRNSVRNRSRVEMGWRKTEVNPDGGATRITAPATEDAARWAGFGTALKPGQEMWWLARKPLAAGTVAANVLQFGTGALNISACKVAHASAADLATSQSKNPGRADKVTSGTYGADRPQQSVDDAGRWPTNLVFTHSAACEPIGLQQVANHGHGPAARGSGGISTSGHRGQDGLTERREPVETVEAWDCAPDCPVAELDRQSGTLTSGANTVKRASSSSRDGNKGPAFGAESRADGTPMIFYGDTGGASRFYPTFRYQAKAPSSERPRLEDGTAHETVKPLGLISWLVRLITPPRGTVLDLFAGSGPVAEACIVEGFSCVLIEQDPKSAELIKTRLSKPIQPVMFGMEAS